MLLRSRLDRAFARYARTGEPAALAVVFDGSAAELYRLAFHLLGDRHLAEDLVQQAFVVAIEQAARFDGERRVLPWLCGILTNRALHLRRQRRQRAAGTPAATDVVVDPLAEANARESAELVARTVRALPEPYRQVLLLHLVHELAPQEIAEALARPDATVRTQLARGLERLRKALPVGLAGLGACTVPPAIGLEVVRAVVLAHAKQQAPVVGAAAAAGVGAIVFSGVVAMKKTLLVVAALLAALSSWLWWSSEPPLPTDPDPRTRTAANVERQQVPIASESAATGAALRTEAPEAFDASLAELEVHVLWHDGTPAADVPVRVRPRPLDFEAWLRAERTGDDGVARFRGLPPGAANALTGRGVSADVELAAGALQRVTITLEKGIDVKGRVVDLDEKPIAGATVWMSVAPASDDSEPVAVSGPDGAFTIRAAAADFVITASAPGYGCAKEGWIHEDTIVVTLRPVPGVVLGSVVDERGRPVVGARVLLGIAGSYRDGVHSRFVGRVFGASLWPSRFLRTDAEGRFRCEGLPPIRWPLWVGAPGFAASWQEVAVRDDGPTEVAVRLGPGATVHGRITNEAGGAVVGAEVDARSDHPVPHEDIGLGVPFDFPPGWGRRFTKTDADGAFMLANVTIGKVKLDAWHASGLRTRTECELRDGQTFEWNAALASEMDSSLQPLHGVLVDEDGTAVTNWELRVEDPNDPRNREQPFNRIWVGDDGSFRTGPMAAGRYLLFAKPRAPTIGTEVVVGEFNVADCPLRVVVPRAHTPNSRVRGRILPPPGVKASDCYAWIIAAEGGEAVIVRCNEHGAFEAGPVLAGRYRLKAEGSAFGQVAWQPIEVVSGRDHDAGTFQVPTPGTLVVRIVDAEGNRLPDAWVSVWPIGDDLRASGLQHSDGIARGNLVAGRWLVSSREGMAMAGLEVDVRPGETTEARFVIPAGVPFRLRVPPPARERGRLRVFWRDANGALLREEDARSFQDVDDRSAPPGRYTLEVVDPRAGVSASTTFDLQRTVPPLVVDLPLPPELAK
jgi:RNA polymerase sigma-70 factor (ECF subfamily)